MVVNVSVEYNGGPLPYNMLQPWTHEVFLSLIVLKVWMRFFQICADGREPTVKLD